MKASLGRIKEGYIRFVERQGFPIIVTVCVAVITATALWTGNQAEPYIAPTPPVAGDVSAAQLLQQSLKDAATPTPAPTDAPRSWTPPLAEFSVLQAFSMEQMVQSGVTGVWSVHGAVDLQAERGAKVFAISDGTVVSAGENSLLGVWMRIDHGEDVEALYAGMALGGAYIPGDEVEAGDVIGFVGDGPLEESDLGPHLHLAVTRDGESVDPLTLFGTEK